MYRRDAEQRAEPGSGLRPFLLLSSSRFFSSLISSLNRPGFHHSTPISVQLTPPFPKHSQPALSPGPARGKGKIAPKRVGRRRVRTSCPSFVCAPLDNPHRRAPPALLRRTRDAESASRQRWKRGDEGARRRSQPRRKEPFDEIAYASRFESK
jgi:hypothetical protein